MRVGFMRLAHWSTAGGWVAGRGPPQPCGPSVHGFGVCMRVRVCGWVVRHTQTKVGKYARECWLCSVGMIATCL